MQGIAEKNRRDSSSMRVLTIITMVYLPCTIVSNFYSTQFVDQIVANDGSSKMGYAQNAWVFFAISIPLTIFTFLVWYSWVRVGDMRKQRAVRLSAEKQAESQV
jgi:Mg2+ and Co2+ transporter CorA